jgi:hypothetical protein
MRVAVITAATVSAGASKHCSVHMLLEQRLHLIHSDDNHTHHVLPRCLNKFIKTPLVVLAS